MQRKISNIKYKLHSIPILLNMKNKSNVLYSIPCVKSCACTFCRIVNKVNNTDSNSHSTNVVWWTSPHLKNQNRSSRIMTPYSRISSWSKITFYTFILLGIGFLGNVILSNSTCYATTSASLSLSTPNMQSSPVSQGSIATTSTDVKVEVSDAESYSLTLKVDSTTLKNGNTTINAGNVVNDNTWGYKWDNATSYTAPSTTAQTLTVPTLSNNTISFTKNLTFGAKFSTNAEAGHYKGSGTLSLVAEPKVITLGIWSNGTNSGITTMQEMTPEVCNQVSTPTAVGTAGSTNAPTLKLIDSRDENEYTIAKLPDGRCWMVENLNLRLSTTKALTSADSNVSSWIPTQNTIVGKDNLTTADFSNSDYYKSQSYAVSASATTTYYSWMAATAGAGTSSVNINGANVNSSICPKGWTLPTSGTGTSTDFWKLFRNMGLTISNDNLVSTLNGYTNWGTGDLAITQGSPYNFAYTGYVTTGSIKYTTAEGLWWSRTAYSSNNAYILYLTSSNVYPGTAYADRYSGLAVRCVASQSSADVSDW